MNRWTIAACACAAVVLVQSAMELHTVYVTKQWLPVVEVKQAPKPVVYGNSHWQDSNTQLVAACKAAVEAAGMKAGLTVQDMAEAPVKRLVDRHVRSCVIKNGLSV